MNRIDAKFKDLKKRRKKAFVAFITAGDPSLAVTERLVVAFENAGVDIVELGVPFSDPLADGLTIQASSERALRRGVTIKKILALVGRIRKKTQLPIALMTYYNPVFHYGEQRFIRQAKNVGVDGLIVPDLPPEEAGNLILLARRYNLSMIFFLSPTTTKKRMKTIVSKASGFIYFVSLTGVTGARNTLRKEFVTKLKIARKLTQKPICVGFGISTPHQVRMVAKVASGVIVGSAIVKAASQYAGHKDCVMRTTRLVRTLTSPLH